MSEGRMGRDIDRHSSVFMRTLYDAVVAKRELSGLLDSSVT